LQGSITSLLLAFTLLLSAGTWACSGRGQSAGADKPDLSQTDVGARTRFDRSGDDADAASSLTDGGELDAVQPPTDGWETGGFDGGDMGEAFEQNAADPVDQEAADPVDQETADGGLEDSGCGAEDCWGVGGEGFPAACEEMATGGGGILYVSAGIEPLAEQDGSEAHPFKSIQQALSVTQPGDCVCVAAGTYDGPVTVEVSWVALVDHNAVIGVQGGAGADPAGTEDKIGRCGDGGAAVGIELFESPGTELTNLSLCTIVPGEAGTSKYNSTVCCDGETSGMRLAEGSGVVIKDSVVAQVVAGPCLRSDSTVPGAVLAASWCVLFECSAVSEGSVELADCLEDDPRFVAPGSDLHLQPDSPCIDAADPASPFALEPSPNGCRADIGAYGNTAEATPKPDAPDCL